MKRVIVALLLCLSLGCAGKQFAFNEGPVRMKCKAKLFWAQVNKPWEYACVVDGDVSLYDDEDILVEYIVKGHESEPSYSMAGKGLGRILQQSTRFSEEYYRELTGNVILERDGQHEFIDPNDPRYPSEPIEGIESSLDGSFWLQITLFKAIDFNPYTGEAQIEFITRGRVRGQLQCNGCKV